MDAVVWHFFQRNGDLGRDRVRLTLANPDILNGFGVGVLYYLKS